MQTREMFERWLNAWIDRSVPGSRLPADRELCRRFGLSRTTIRRVLCLKAREGRVIRVKGKGTFVPRPPDRNQGTEDTTVRLDAVDSIVDEIAACIGRGALKRGDPLPSYKKLCSDFNVSPVTVSRAFSILRGKGLVCKIGKYYRTGRFLDSVRSVAHPGICFLYPRSLDVSRLFTAHEIALSFNKMENELHMCGYQVQYAHLETFRDLANGWIADRRCPHGIIVCGGENGFVDDNELHALLPDIDHLFAHFRYTRPKVLMVTMSSICIKPGVEFFSAPHAIVGMRRRIARFLFEKGYRRACVFFTAEKNWFPGKFFDSLRLIPEVAVLNPSFDLSFAVKLPGESCTPEQFWERFFEVYPPGHVDSRLSKYGPLSIRDRMKTVLFVKSFHDVFTGMSTPGAWIFEQDENAAEALQWCASNGRMVPQDISIIGLQNDRRFYHLGITVCVRDWEGMGYVMAHALIGDIPLRRTRRGFIDGDVLLLERRTTPR